MEIIRKEYDSGITLEEAARQLYVSEEYLSSQFKKETGYNFTETVRKYRIEQLRTSSRRTMANCQMCCWNLPPQWIWQIPP